MSHWKYPFLFLEIPSFTKTLKDETLLQDAQLKFEVLVTGHPKPEVAWFKDETKLKSSKQLKIEKKENAHTLTITKSCLADAGNYRVKATNVAGEAITECSAQIQGTKNHHFIHSHKWK